VFKHSLGIQRTAQPPAIQSETAGARLFLATIAKLMLRFKLRKSSLSNRPGIDFVRLNASGDRGAFYMTVIIAVVPAIGIGHHRSHLLQSHLTAIETCQLSIVGTG
jgi:hypothetical protein